VTKDESSPFELAQTDQSALHALPHLPAEDRAFLPRRHSSGRHVVERGASILVTLFPPQLVDSAVRGDALEPGSEVRACFEAVELLVRAYKRILHGILRILFVSGNPEGEPKDIPAISFDERPEGILVP
jgi:hypothetical protein